MASTLYPTIHGFRVNPGVELSGGWNERQLRDVMYVLRANPDDDALLLESCTGREADALLNPGAAMVLEAVTAQYNKLGRTMAALARVLGRHLPESLTLEGEPYIGPDRKNALFAYKVVTFNVSDGQTVSVLFHSPDNDPKKFQSDETLIAYRWMLNKLDITASVAPENGRDITLELMAKRMAQLIEANSAKFQEQNAAREERTAALADAEARREELRARTETAADEITALEDDLQSLASRASKTAERLEAERARNERLKTAKATQPEPVEPVQPEPAEPMTVEQARKALEDAQKRAREYRNTNNEGGYGFNPYDAEVEQAMQSLQDARNRELLADAEGYRARWNSAVQKYAKNGQLATGDLKKVEQEAGMTANEAKWLKEHATQPEPTAPTQPSLETDLTTYRDLVKAGDTDAAEELATQAPGRHGISYRDFIEKAGVSHETFATTPYADPRTRYAAALAEELAMAGFTPYDFPTGQPEFELGQYTAIASMQMAAGSGSVYVNEVAAGKATVEVSYNPEMQPGFPVQASPRQTFTFDVPVGVLEGKFDDVVGEISGWLAQFGTAFDGVKLPEFGEKLKTDGVNQHDAADIAKRIRQDIKAMLPPGFKPSMFTVRSSKYSMGQSIKIGVKEVPEGFRLFESEATEDQYGDKRYPMTRDALALLKALKAIGNAYRYDNSDSQTDYFDTNFYFDAGYDRDLMDAQRAMAENAKVEPEPVEPEPSMPANIDPATTSVGDAVVWRNEFGTMTGTYRGMIDAAKAMIVVNGMQMPAPITELFPEAADPAQPEPVEPTQPEPEMAPHEAISAALKAGDLSAALDVIDGLGVQELRDAVLRAGFSFAESKTKKQIMDYVGSHMIEAARRKTDGFGLRQADQSEPSGNTPNPEEQNVTEVEAIAAELQKLADGAVTDTGEFDQMLDDLADRAEKAGAMEELDGLLNAAADKLTELLEKEAASVA